MMWMLKERAENSSVRSILPQIGAIWQLGMGKYASGGKAELYRHLSNYMQGPLNNPALLSDVINMVENGQPVNALEAFGSFYMASSIGTWTHINIPKNIRTVAHIIPGADQFFTASSLGTYRLISAMANMGDLTTRQKAQVIASAVALAGISTGLGVVANETGFDWFQRISPLQWASASVMGPSQKSNQKYVESDWKWATDEKWCSTGNGCKSYHFDGPIT
jgi:hypothetical protein